MVPGPTRKIDPERHVCVNCGQPFFYKLNPEGPHKPGDIYSTAGMRETAISGLCEYCFDAITMVPDEEDDIDNISRGSDPDS